MLELLMIGSTLIDGTVRHQIRSARLNVMRLAPNLKLELRDARLSVMVRDERRAISEIRAVRLNVLRSTDA